MMLLARQAETYQCFFSIILLPLLSLPNSSNSSSSRSRNIKPGPARTGSCLHFAILRSATREYVADRTMERKKKKETENNKCVTLRQTLTRLLFLSLFLFLSCSVNTTIPCYRYSSLNIVKWERAVSTASPVSSLHEGCRGRKQTNIQRATPALLNETKRRTSPKFL